MRTDTPQISSGVGMLRFDKSLEDDFRRQQIDQTRIRLRVGAKFLMGVILVFMIADIYRLRDAALTGEWLYIGLIQVLRILPMAPVIAGLLLMHDKRRRGTPDQLRRLSVASLALLGVSTLAVLILHYQKPELSRIPFSLSGLNLVVLAYFFPSGIPYRTSVCMALGLIVTTLILMPLALPASVIGTFWAFAPYMVLTGVIAGMSAMLHEVTQRKQFLLERQLRHAAERDTLTALYNRGAFMLLCEQSMAAARRAGSPLSLLLIDIDHFKAYNDHYGHPAGDTALACVADALASIGNREVDLTARLGGEEFAVVLYGTPADQAARMAETFRLHVQNELALSHATSGTHANLTVSIGIAALDPKMTLTTLYKLADDALYVAKKTGRNNVSVSPHSSPVPTPSGARELHISSAEQAPACATLH